ncbi:FadR/GntR family transcriptional regulator [Methyloligella sp. 2.7D]|uniref:FadR/GntR family transcriptional regulator n=1 Tax=unclassified Methyloligella TaxID=2625955 RepID=UPI00157DC41D|nr:FadR/GntR family transcriptional regulator [Methyloligella sp. GL2]QKP77936.1 FadR family transcriptional regulator [Methyloligella sp. GL2]
MTDNTMDVSASGQGPEKKISPVHLTPAYELVVDQIRRAIHLGMFLPGQKLPSERDLAEQMSVSRSTIREAVRVLVADGSVSVRRGASGGLIVNHVHAKDTEELRIYAQRKRLELNEIFDFRVIIEEASAELAAQRRTEADLQNMLAALQDMNTAIAATSEDDNDPDPIASFNAADTRFHMGIAKASKNAHLLASVEGIRRAMFLPVGGVFIKLRKDANDIHEPIYNAIADRDAQRAGEFMVEHVQATRRAMMEFLDGRR